MNADSSTPESSPEPLPHDAEAHLSDDADQAHIPVLRTEVLEHLAPLSGARVLDCTLGLGGHAEALIEQGAHVLGVDRDPAARERAHQRLASAGERFEMVADTYAGAAEHFVQDGQQFDGVLADLGVSSLQLDDLQRGFSIRSDGDLDLRMGAGCKETALQLIDRLSEGDLADVLWYYGEERHSRRIAAALKRAREDRDVRSGYDIAEVVRACLRGRHPRHPALRTFQALRIAINDELGQLERLLAVLPGLLKPGGRAVIISFHSLEDRMVKRALRGHVIHNRLETTNRKVVIAGEVELADNRRAHSAKMRWARANPS